MLMHSQDSGFPAIYVMMIVDKWSKVKCGISESV